MSDLRPTIPVTRLGADDPAGICEIDPLTGLMVCDLPAAAPTEKQAKEDVAPAAAPKRPTGDQN